MVQADLIVENAVQVVTCDPTRGTGGRVGLVERGAVAAGGERIVWIGPAARAGAEVRLQPNGQRLDAAGRVVLPGFVDSHTHLVFAGSREKEFAMRARGASYTEIAAVGGGILSTVRATRMANLEQLVELGRQRLDRMLAHGTTTCEAKSGYGLSLEDELKILEAIRRLDKEHAVGVFATLCAAQEVPDEFKGRPDAYINLVVDKMLPEVAARGLARYIDVICEQGVFSLSQARHVLEAGARHTLRAKFHADEFSAMGGAELAAEVRALSADHLLKANMEGIYRMKAAGVTATLLPSVPFSLGLPYAPARRYLDAGVRVALASDFNPGSSMGFNLQLVMTLAVTQMKMTLEEALLGVTLHAAQAMGLESEVGSLRPGKICDLILCDVTDWQQLAYNFGVNHVSQVIKRGRVAWGA
ncbi:MAG TPA: imidazolonepropionase [Methylomirabilota bacterium]|jgi:imidazolonepropionase|nr:imidazolonepropionase [Methylomirabilota bacterium]